VLTRRALLVRGLRAASAAALLPLLTDDLHAVALQRPAADQDAGSTKAVKVRVGEIVQETRADFAGGQLDRLDQPRAGGQAGLSAGPQGGVFTSAVLSTDFPASHVGLHWRSDGDVGLELRTSADGGRWSRWQTLLLEARRHETPRDETFGSLVSARGASFLQYRATFPTGQRSVNLERVALTYMDAQPRLRPMASSRPFASLLAGPADFRSQIIPREVWGADEELRFGPDGTEVWPRAYVPAKKAIVHHTATTNDYADAAAELRAIYTYHAQTLGWGDIGYHLLIDDTGQVYEGRRGRDQDPAGGSGREIASQGVVGGHATNHNYGSTGIALIGNFQEAPLPSVMRDRLEEALAFECQLHGIDPLGRSDYLLQNDLWRDDLADVPGHRDCTPIECPGDEVYEQLPRIRQAVAGRLALADRPRVGPVLLEQGRNPWPGMLNFSWSGLPRAQFSTSLEGWFRLPGQDEIFQLSGYEQATSLPAWGPWSNETTASFAIPSEAHGHYTLHVRTRTAPGVESVVWSRFTALVEPQLPVDNSDDDSTTADGQWYRDEHPREYYGRDYAYSPPDAGESVFRWRLAAPVDGRYVVQACWISLENLSTAAAFTISIDGRQAARANVDQTVNSFSWQTLAELGISAGQTCEVSLRSASERPVVADAVRLLLL
jgi:hypothetical protein